MIGNNLYYSLQVFFPTVVYFLGFCSNYFNFFLLLFKGAVSRNSAKLGNYKMPVKLRET